MGQVLDPPWVEFMPWRRGLPLGYKRARKQVLIAGRRGGCEECERWLCRPDASRVRTHCCSCSGEGEDKMAGREERWTTLATRIPHALRRTLRLHCVRGAASLAGTPREGSPLQSVACREDGGRRPE